jgi:hypothetical protein
MRVEKGRRRGGAWGAECRVRRMGWVKPTEELGRKRQVGTAHVVVRRYT